MSDPGERITDDSSALEELLSDERFADILAEHPNLADSLELLEARAGKTTDGRNVETAREKYRRTLQEIIDEYGESVRQEDLAELVVVASERLNPEFAEEIRSDEAISEALGSATLIGFGEEIGDWPITEYRLFSEMGDEEIEAIGGGALSFNREQIDEAGELLDPFSVLPPEVRLGKIIKYETNGRSLVDTVDGLQAEIDHPDIAADKKQKKEKELGEAKKARDKFAEDWSEEVERYLREGDKLRPSDEAYQLLLGIAKDYVRPTRRVEMMAAADKKLEEGLKTALGGDFDPQAAYLIKTAAVEGTDEDLPIGRKIELAKIHAKLSEVGGGEEFTQVHLVEVASIIESISVHIGDVMHGDAVNADIESKRGQLANIFSETMVSSGIPEDIIAVVMANGDAAEMLGDLDLRQKQVLATIEDAKAAFVAEKTKIYESGFSEEKRYDNGHSVDFGIQGRSRAGQGANVRDGVIHDTGIRSSMLITDPNRITSVAAGVDGRPVALFGHFSTDRKPRKKETTDNERGSASRSYAKKVLSKIRFNKVGNSGTAAKLEGYIGAASKKDPDHLQTAAYVGTLHESTSSSSFDAAFELIVVGEVENLPKVYVMREGEVIEPYSSQGIKKPGKKNDKVKKIAYKLQDGDRVIAFNEGSFEANKLATNDREQAENTINVLGLGSATSAYEATTKALGYVDNEGGTREDQSVIIMDVNRTGRPKSYLERIREKNDELDRRARSEVEAENRARGILTPEQVRRQGQQLEIARSNLSAQEAYVVEAAEQIRELIDDETLSADVAQAFIDNLMDQAEVLGIEEEISDILEDE